MSTLAADFKVNRAEVIWRLSPDFTVVQDVLIEREALSIQGAERIGKFAQFYNKGVQSLEVVEAYTLKADGRRLAVTAAGMQAQTGVASSSSMPSWSEAEIRQVTFPDVQRGDRTVIRMRLTTSKPNLPHWASFADWLPPIVAYEAFAARVEAPRQLGLKLFAHDLRVQHTAADETQIWEVAGRSAAKVMDPNPANTTEKRDFATVCTPVTMREEFEIWFAPEFKILHVPAAFSESDADGIRFTANYTRDGNTVSGVRELVLSHDRNACTPEQYAGRRAVMNRIARHLRGGLIYQQ